MSRGDCPDAGSSAENVKRQLRNNFARGQIKVCNQK